MRQNDNSVRIVSLANLRAMADHASGMTHRYSVAVSKNRCSLTYSNPDEYGTPNPYTVRLPLLRTEEPENPDVLLHVMSEHGGGDSYGKEACFQSIETAIFSAPSVHYDHRTGAWMTTHELLEQRGTASQQPRGPFRVRQETRPGSVSHVVQNGAGADMVHVLGWPVHPSAGECPVSRKLAEDIAWKLTQDAERAGRPTVEQERAWKAQQEGMARAEARRKEWAEIRKEANAYIAAARNPDNPGGTIPWDIVARVAEADGKGALATRIRAAMADAAKLEG